MCEFSFVIPVYNSEKTLEQVVEGIILTLYKMGKSESFEIVLVDDASADSSFKVMEKLHRKHSEVKILRLYRNFGQACALMAGLNNACGEYVVCLDDDLQTPPGEFPKLYEKLLETDADVVYAYYPKEKASPFRVFGTKMNDFMESKVFGKPQHLKTSSYFIARKEVVDTVKSYDKPFPYLPGLFMRATNRISCVAVTHSKRAYGKSGYTLHKLLSLWIDGFSNFTISPLRFSSAAGTFLTASAFVVLIVAVIRKIMVPQSSMGLVFIAALVLFVGGIQLLSAGIIGEYIGRILLSINKTPQFLIREKGEPFEEHALKEANGNIKG